MSGLTGSLVKLTASATPLLLESSADLREFAIQRWLFSASFVEDAAIARIHLARLAGIAAVVGLIPLSEQARRLRKYLKHELADSPVLLQITQELFNKVLDDAKKVSLIAHSDKSFTWLEAGFLEEAEWAAKGT